VIGDRQGHWSDGIGVQPPEVTSLPQRKTEHGDLPTQIKELAALHESGALSDDEFAQAKQRLLG
jgi:hypothetical protein